MGVSYPNVSRTVYRDYGTDRTANTGDDLLTSYLFRLRRPDGERLYH